MWLIFYPHTKVGRSEKTREKKWSVRAPNEWWSNNYNSIQCEHALQCSLANESLAIVESVNFMQIKCSFIAQHNFMLPNASNYTVFRCCCCFCLFMFCASDTWKHIYNFRRSRFRFFFIVFRPVFVFNATQKNMIPLRSIFFFSLPNHHINSLKKRCLTIKISEKKEDMR